MTFPTPEPFWGVLDLQGPSLPHLETQMKLQAAYRPGTVIRISKPPVSLNDYVDVYIDYAPERKQP